MRSVVLSVLFACALAVDASAAWAQFAEVPASTSSPAHLDFSNSAVKLRVFPNAGHSSQQSAASSQCVDDSSVRIEGCSNLCALVASCVSTNANMSWRMIRSRDGEKTLWLELSPTNGVSRTLGLTLRGGASPLNLELILANGDGASAEVAVPVRANLQPFERRTFHAIVTNDLPMVLAANPESIPMSAAQGRLRARAFDLGCAACSNGEFKVALEHFDRAIGEGGVSAPLYVLKAYCLRKLGVRSNRLRAEASKTLRFAEDAEPLDVMNRIERAFLEDDGEGLRETASAFGGDPQLHFSRMAELYRRIGANEESLRIDPPSPKLLRTRN